ncbi:MAG: hypothetical protein QW609_04280 [Candidatus Aenigmatarchaeota archaeon]
MNYEIDVINKRLNQIRKLKSKCEENTVEYAVFDNLEEIYLIILRLYKRK